VAEIEITCHCLKKTGKRRKDMNKVILAARVSSAVRATKLPSGTIVARVDLAYNRKYKDKNGNWRDEVNFFEIEAYGKTALRLQEIAQKGNLLLIEGRLSQDIWEKDGKKQSKVRIKAVKLQLLSKPKTQNDAQNTDTKQEKTIIEEEVIAF
jgi:single-strand DNA-binding protein